MAWSQPPEIRTITAAARGLMAAEKLKPPHRECRDVTRMTSDLPVKTGSKECLGVSSQVVHRFKLLEVFFNVLQLIGHIGWLNC